MNRMRSQEAIARDYCASIDADPDEMVWGGFDTGGGRIEWLESPRWTWYRGANPEWARPLSNYERAQLRQSGNT